MPTSSGRSARCSATARRRRTPGTHVNGNVYSYNEVPKEQCWIYANTGICAFVMEISLQYWWTGAVVDTIAARFGRGHFYLMERALSGPGLTGFVTAAHTGLPVEAEIVVQQVHDPRHRAAPEPTPTTVAIGVC